jgi:mono/diheme cytochrome c family protein
VLATLAIAAAGLTGCGGSSSSTDNAAGGGDKAADGKQIFIANCGSCHTLAAAGTKGASGPDLTNLKVPEATVKTQVENGGKVMPPFKDKLSAEEIEEVSEYVADNDGSSK